MQTQQIIEFQRAYRALVAAIENINGMEKEKAEQHKRMLLGFINAALQMPSPGEREGYPVWTEKKELEPEESLFWDDGDIFPRAGLDYEELENMTPGERREVLLKAGLNPDEFDF